MAKPSSMTTPLKGARGLGSGKSGTTHFWQQRMTGLASLVLSVIYVFLLLKLQGDDYATVTATLGNPIVATLMIAFVIVGVYHGKIGMQVIIEDYVNQPFLRVLSLVANTFFCVAVGLAAVVALLKISFGA